MTVIIDKEKFTVQIGITSVWGNVLTHLNIFTSMEVIDCKPLLEYKKSNFTNNDIFLALVNSNYSDK
jgi:hypothetical protein